MKGQMYAEGTSWGNVCRRQQEDAKALTVRSEERLVASGIIIRNRYLRLRVPKPILEHERSLD